MSLPAAEFHINMRSSAQDQLRWIILFVILLILHQFLFPSVKRL